MKTTPCAQRLQNDVDIDYVHTVSFSLAFYIVLRPQGIRKQMKTLRKRHRVYIALHSDGNCELRLTSISSSLVLKL